MSIIDALALWAEPPRSTLRDLREAVLIPELRARVRYSPSMIALSSMDPTVTFLFYLAAVVCFVLAALGTGVLPRLTLGWLGLAFFAFPSMWNALAAA